MGGVAGKSGDLAGMPKCEWAFQIHEVTEGNEKFVEGLFVEWVVMVGGGAQCRVPGIAGLRTGEDRVGVGDEGVDDGRVEVLAAAVGRHGHRGCHSTEAVVDLGHVGQLSHPHLDRDLVAARARGKAAAVVAFEAETDGLLHASRQPHSFGQQCRRRAMRVDQP